MSESVEIQNNKLTLESIQADVRDAAELLTNVYAEHAQEKTAYADTQSAHKSIQETMADDRADMAQKHLTLDQRTVEMDSKEKFHKKEVEVAETQKRSALKELGQVNGWVMAAKDELATKKAEIAEMDKKLLEKAELETSLAKIKEENAAEEKKRDAVRLETSLLLENTDVAVGKLLKKADKAKEEMADAEQRSAMAKTELENAITDKERIKRDGEIYINRIEEKYGQAFPELHAKF